MAKLDNQIVTDLLSEKEDLIKNHIERLENIGVENLGLEETEDYGFFKGRLSMIEELLQKYK